MTTELDNPMLLFPAEIWLHIAGSLSTKELRQLVQTTTKLHQVLMSNKEVWMAAIKREGKYLEFYGYLPLSTILHGQKYQLTERQWIRQMIPGGWFR